MLLRVNDLRHLRFPHQHLLLHEPLGFHFGHLAVNAAAVIEVLLRRVEHLLILRHIVCKHFRQEAQPLVDVCSNHILVLALEPFVRKLFPDLVSFFRRHFTDVKRLDQMTGKYLRHLHSLLHCKVSRPLKFFRCRVACSASIGRNVEGIVSLLRVENIGESLVYSSSDWLDFSNCHISPCLSFSSAISSA